jgi:hypothetical protein
MKRRDWYGEEQPGAEHPVDERVRAALRSVGQARRLATRITALTARLSRTTTPEQLRLWLEIDEAQTERLKLERAEFYNLGVEKGLAMRDISHTLREARRRRAKPSEVISLLARTLAKAAERME